MSEPLVRDIDLDDLIARLMDALDMDLATLKRLTKTPAFYLEEAREEIMSAIADYEDDLEGGAEEEKL